MPPRKNPLTLVVDQTKPLASDEARWRAVLARDASQDGRFYFAVKTTGVVCRPSCPSRTAKRGNVTFFESLPAALAAGFRACRRCKPEGASQSDTDAARIRKACDLLSSAEARVPLDALAAAVCLSAYHFHRLFKSVTGVTPRQYQAEVRAGRVRAGLATPSSVTAALFDAGFGSAARFYDAAPAVLGMRPVAFKRGGQGETIQYAVASSTLGQVMVAMTGKGICSIEFGAGEGALKDRLAGRFPHATLQAADAGAQALVQRVVAAIESPESAASLPLDIRGTAFQHRVWRELTTLRRGETVSYAELARRIGQPGAARAVASACAQNGIAVLVPCHRVVRADGALSGYRWGVERKRELLDREQRIDSDRAKN
ncbi:MAG: bifunctional DNA-binding transcriptional regulator/O6-methylguanine-DNA methyltransferase Ada [Betaproteobacteria bacterium]|nr:bifunctional DNA-binding transcriptional regulator/O6-methylguanine-DNA methyltransferase Ada [Betaproteobacteria bacterium]